WPRVRCARERHSLVEVMARDALAQVLLERALSDDAALELAAGGCQHSTGVDPVAEALLLQQAATHEQPGPTLGGERERKVRQLDAVVDPVHARGGLGEQA